MHGISTQSLAEVLAAVDAAVEAGSEPATLGEELFAVVRMLDGQPVLRRLLLDPGVEGPRKADLLRNLLRGKISESATQVLVEAATKRWATSRDLENGLEQAGVSAYLAEAERSGQLDELEDELFRFGRIAEAEPELREALSDRTAPLAAKRQLLNALLAEKASQPAQRLLREAVTGRHQTFLAAVASYQKLAAARRNRLVATARVAAPLSEEHKERLATALQRLYGKAVQLNVLVDPQVLGGVRVHVEDEVIDSTVLTRLADARRRLAG